MAESETDLTQELRLVRAELARLNSHRFIRIHNSLPRLILFQFARGLALGLGTVIGATLLFSAAVYLLSTIDFIPILGQWATEIVRQIEESRN